MSTSNYRLDGARRGIRIPGLPLRRGTLYPAELYGPIVLKPAILRGLTPYIVFNVWKYPHLRRNASLHFTVWLLSRQELFSKAIRTPSKLSRNSADSCSSFYLGGGYSIQLSYGDIQSRSLFKGPDYFIRIPCFCQEKSALFLCDLSYTVQ